MHDSVQGRGTHSGTWLANPFAFVMGRGSAKQESIATRVRTLAEFALTENCHAYLRQYYQQD
jgi:hypothetical protein